MAFLVVIPFNDRHQALLCLISLLIKHGSGTIFAA